MATRWACLGAGKISSDFFLAMRENLPREDHEVVTLYCLSLSLLFAETCYFQGEYKNRE